MQSQEIPVQPIILAYHHVCDRFQPAITRVTIKQFQKQIGYLKTQEFVTSRLSDYFLLNKQNLRQQPCILITFDDAFSCFYKHALPTLLENGMKATVFVITKYVGKTGGWDYYQNSKSCAHLDWAQLKELVSSGCEIGSHSHSHVDLKSLATRQLKNELEYSKKLLEDRLGTEVRCFSYPFGRFDRKIKLACQQANYQAAVTMNPTAQKPDLFALPRLAVYLVDWLPQFRRKIRTNPPSRLEQIKLTTVNFFSMGTILVRNMALR